MTAQRALWVARDPSNNGTSPKGARLSTGGLLAHDGASALSVRKGVVWDGAGAAVAGKADMSYDVRALVAITMASSTNGPTIVANDGIVNVPTDAAPGSGSRIDVVYIRQKLLTGDGGSEVTNDAEIGVAKGASSGSPTVPSIPVGALALAQITVTAGATATNTLVVQRVHRWTAAAGGVIRVESSTERTEITLEGTVIYYVPDQVHQALISGVWEPIGGEAPDLTAKTQAATRVAVPSGTGGVNVSIVFPVPFAGEPSVQLTVNHPDLKNARITAQTATGFTARFDRDSAATYWFNWTATLP